MANFKTGSTIAYTVDSNGNHQKVDITSGSSFSNLNPNAPTWVITHGFYSEIGKYFDNDDDIRGAIKNYMDARNMTGNIIFYDWKSRSELDISFSDEFDIVVRGDYSSIPDYKRELRNNASDVAEEINDLLQNLSSHGNIASSDMILYGHSLGGHIMGKAAADFHTQVGTQIGTLIGADTSDGYGTDFYYIETYTIPDGYIEFAADINANWLDKSDAEKVIHLQKSDIGEKYSNIADHFISFDRNSNGTFSGNNQSNHNNVNNNMEDLLEGVGYRQNDGTIFTIEDIFSLSGNSHISTNNVSNPNIFAGDNNNNQISGNDNTNDIIYGNNGNDTLDGSGGNDTLNGGLGDDIFYGGNGEDRIWGGKGNDYIRGQHDDDSIWGEDGNDTLRGQRGNDSLSGGSGNDLMRGNENNDSLSGGSGEDTLEGGNGSDTLLGGSGNDTYLFDADTDLGTDTIIEVEQVLLETVHNTYIRAERDGRVDQDTYPGDWSKFIVERVGEKVTLETPHRTFLRADRGTSTIDQADQPGPWEQFTVERVGDKVTLKTHHNTYLQAMSDGSVNQWDWVGVQEQFTVSAEADSGTDTLDFSATETKSISIDLSQASEQVVNDNLRLRLDSEFAISIENVIGGELNDSITGDNTDNKLDGFAGNDSLFGDYGEDTLEGGSGNDLLHGGHDNDSLVGGEGDDLLKGRQRDDTLIGGAGNDTLIGGWDHDTFVFDSSQGVDLIDGFNVSHDQIQIDQSAFNIFEATNFAKYEISSNGNGTYTLGYAARGTFGSDGQLSGVDYELIAIIEDVAGNINDANVSFI